MWRSKFSNHRLLNYKVAPPKWLDACLITMLSIVLTPVTFANVVGSPFQNFNPTATAHDFVTVHSSKTLTPGQFSLGLFLNLATNTLPYTEQGEDTKQSRSSINDSLVSSDLVASFGVWRNLELTMAIPAVLSQSVKDKSGSHGQFAREGISELRLGAKYSVLRRGGFGLATILSTNINQTDENPYNGKGGGPGINLELASDFQLGALLLAGNIGYRMPGSGKGDDSLPVQPYQEQLLSSFAVAYTLPGGRSQLISEIYGSQPLKKESDLTERKEQSSELLLGLKRSLNDALSLHTGIGTELLHGVSTPDWRLYAGLQWSPPRNRPQQQTVRQRRPRPQPSASQIQPDQVVVMSDVLFEFNSARVVNRGALDAIGKLAESIKNGPEIAQVIVEGHTCSVGDAAYNLRLSRERAQNIRTILITKHQIPANKIQAVGYGETRPVGDNNTFNGRKQNRRVEFKIYHAKGMVSH